MDLFDYLAIFGALAWIPPVVVMIKNQLIKPNIIIKNEREFEVGYTTFGPIINAQLAFISDTKKALIEKIEVELTHENNDTNNFTWTWFEELLYETNFPEGANIPTKKHLKAIAINLKKEELTINKIGFQKDSFKVELQKINQNTIEEAINLGKAGKPASDLMSQHNYNALLDYYNHSFSWRTGSYNMIIKVKASGTNKIFQKKLQFSLTPLQVNNLQANVDLCKHEVERILINPELESVSWQWIYPTVSED